MSLPPARIIVVDDLGNADARGVYDIQRCSQCGLKPIACRCDTQGRNALLYHKCIYQTNDTTKCTIDVPHYRNFCYIHQMAVDKEAFANADSDAATFVRIVNHYRRIQVARCPGDAFGRLRADAQWHDFACHCWLCEPDEAGVTTPAPVQEYEFAVYNEFDEVLAADDTTDDGVIDYNHSYITLDNRRRMKVGMALDNIHFRLQTSGKRDDIDVFHYLMKKIDNDYPLDPFRKNGEQLPFCKKCHGMLWRRCALQPEQIKRLAKQCDVRLKINRYVMERKCGGSSFVAQVV